MSLFDLPIDEAVEPEVAPEGECELSIYSAEQTTAKRTGRDMIRVVLQNLTYPSGQKVYHNLLGVMDSDEPASRNGILLSGKRFCKTFNLVPPLSPDEMPGHTGRVLLTIEEDNNGVPRNTIARFL